MRTLVDTTIWSCAYRQRNLKPQESALNDELSELVQEHLGEIVFHTIC